MSLTIQNSRSSTVNDTIYVIRVDGSHYWKQSRILVDLLRRNVNFYNKINTEPKTINRSRLLQWMSWLFSSAVSWLSQPSI